MRNLKKVLALALALVMTLSLMTVANAFTDEANINSNYAEAVDVLAGMGVFEGYEDGSFQAKGSITRAEVAAIIYRIVTGDVNDAQDEIYAEYANFTDVKATAWYAGYVGYCANAGYIKGYGDGTFGPADKVTGYQALAMILRAMGYDQNGEFTGKEWVVNVASIAQQRGILVNVASSDVLIKAATRELVAEILFQAIQKNVVVYTPALGYVTTALVGGLYVESLGWKTFGLTCDYGYITANQATGETYTVLAEALVPVAATTGTAGTWAQALNMTTGLEQFGHYTKVWYNGKQTLSTVYASYDLGASTTVTDTEYQALVAKSASDVVAYSNSYAALSATGNVWSYNVMVTNPGVNNDALIALNLDIAQYLAINKYTTNPYLTVKSGAANANQNIYLSNAVGYETLALGTYVNVLTVNGTKVTATNGFPQKQISALGVISGVSVTYVDAYKTLTLNNGSSVKSSSTTHQGYAANVNSAMAVPSTWNFAVSYNLYTDMFGNYVGAQVVSNAIFGKLTYAWYETNPATAEHAYYGQIVKNDGSTETVKLALDATSYNALTCNKLTWSGNSVTATAYMDVILQPTVAGYAIAHKVNDGDCQWHSTVVGHAGLTNVSAITNAPSWTVDAKTVSMGANKNYFVDAATKFVVVSGFGGTLKVTTYTGVAELLGGNKEATIAGTSVVTATQVYSANVGSQNYHVDYVLIESASWTAPSSLIYVASATPVGYDGSAYYYNCYINGEAKQLPVSYTGTIEGGKFYNYTINKGVYVLSGVATSGCADNYGLTKVAGTAYLYVNSIVGGVATQLPITESAKIVNLTTVVGVPTTAAELAVAAENNTVVADIEIVDGAVTVVYIVSYT